MGTVCSFLESEGPGSGGFGRKRNVKRKGKKHRAPLTIQTLLETPKQQQDGGMIHTPSTVCATSKNPFTSPRRTVAKQNPQSANRSAQGDAEDGGGLSDESTQPQPQKQPDPSSPHVMVVVDQQSPSPHLSPIQPIASVNTPQRSSQSPSSSPRGPQVASTPISQPPLASPSASSHTHAADVSLSPSQNLASPGPSPVRSHGASPPVQSVPYGTTPVRSTALTRADVATHRHRNDTWLVVRGNVFDVTSFASRHPGGASVIQQAAGQDATRTFLDNHGPSAWDALQSYCIGDVRD